MGGYHRRVPQEGTTGGYHGRVPWEGTTGGYHRRVPQEGTTGGYHGRVPWEAFTPWLPSGYLVFERHNEHKKIIATILLHKCKFDTQKMFVI